MAYFPFMIDIQDKDCLVVGGGKIAYRKILSLLEYGANVTVVATSICDDIVKLSLDNLKVLGLYEREYADKDVDGRFLVIAATGIEELDRYISDRCKLQGILVNAVDVTDACSFIFPAIIKKNDLVISISTGGNSPAGAAYLRKKIEKAVPRGYELNLSVLGECREIVMDRIDNMSDRKDFYYQVLQYCDNNNFVLTKEMLMEHIDKFLKKKEK